jgi:hypothetical protein
MIKKWNKRAQIKTTRKNNKNHKKSFWLRKTDVNNRKAVAENKHISNYKLVNLKHRIEKMRKL